MLYLFCYIKNISSKIYNSWTTKVVKLKTAPTTTQAATTLPPVVTTTAETEYDAIQNIAEEVKIHKNLQIKN